MSRTKALNKILNLLDVSENSYGNEAEIARKLAADIQRQWSITDFELWRGQKAQLTQLVLVSDNPGWLQMAIPLCVGQKWPCMGVRQEGRVKYWVPENYCTHVLMEHVGLLKFSFDEMEKAWEQHEETDWRLTGSGTGTGGSTVTFMASTQTRKQFKEEKFKRSVVIGIIQGMVDVLSSGLKGSGSSGLPVWKPWKSREQIIEHVRKKHPHFFEDSSDDESEKIEVYDEVFKRYYRKGKNEARKT